MELGTFYSVAEEGKYNDLRNCNNNRLINNGEIKMGQVVEVVNEIIETIQ